jgi:RNA recognition motif-containing protein
VGNLLYTASRTDVEALFTENGFVISGISMAVDPFTGRNPSYAFVDFETAEEASRAMEALNGMEVLGRGVKINPGVRRQEGSGAVKEGRGRGYDSGKTREYDGGKLRIFIVGQRGTDLRCSSIIQLQAVI